MLHFKNDKRIVLTLDAGGTNFVFSAIQGGVEIVRPIIKPSNAHDLTSCLNALFQGFSEVKKGLSTNPVAISFAFPGPADYPNGIIGDLPNLPAFRGGVALGAYLENKFNIPVFINNDGDLFAYGEALGGVLPEINQQLMVAANKKQYHNLIGLTLGTGFGAGLVFNGQMLKGDNAIGAEVWLLSNRINSNCNIEEIVSMRFIISEYKSATSNSTGALTPFELYKIAKGEKAGDKLAAANAFKLFGKGLGDAIANLITLFDAIVVLGGGITGAKNLYMPALMKEVERNFEGRNGMTVQRTVQKIYDYDNIEAQQEFLRPEEKKIVVPESDAKVVYNYVPKVVLCHSKLGASKAIQMGAYAYALEKISKS